MNTLLLFILIAIPLFFLWAFIHEEAHAFVCKRLRPDATFTKKYYPHTMPSGRLVFAAYYSKFKGELTDSERARIAIAPAVCDMAAIGLLHLSYLLLGAGIVQTVIMILCVGGLVDLITFSIGKSPESDLQRVGRVGVDVWKLRIYYWAFILSTLYPLLSTLA